VGCGLGRGFHAVGCFFVFLVVSVKSKDVFNQSQFLLKFGKGFI
jgi:hypothetical protein